MPSNPANIPQPTQPTRDPAAPDPSVGAGLPTAERVAARVAEWALQNAGEKAAHRAKVKADYRRIFGGNL
jgi:hypothetical protein